MTVLTIRSFLDFSFFILKAKIFQPVVQAMASHQKKRHRPLSIAAFRSLNESYLHYRCFVKPRKHAVHAEHAERLDRLRALAQSRRLTITELA